MNTQAKFALLSTVAILITGFAVAENLFAQPMVVSPGDWGTEPLPRLTRPDRTASYPSAPQSIVVHPTVSNQVNGNATLELPKAPTTSEPLEQLINRLSDEGVPAPVVESTPDTVDFSGDDIRDAVKEKFDRQFEAGFDRDGWEDVSQEGWSHNVGGRIVMDYASWWDDGEIGGASDYFEMRQARLEMQGKGYGVYHYKIQLEFEPEVRDTDAGATVATFGSVGMKDVFFGIEDVPLFGRVTVGHQKVPFSFSQMLSRRNMVFGERPIMSDAGTFTPGREVGLSALRVSNNQEHTFGYGIFFDNISEVSKERVDDNLGVVIGSRHTYTPFYDEPSNGRYLVHLGSGFIYRKPQSHVARFRSPVTHEGPVYIDSGTMTGNEYTVYGFEFAAQAGPATIQSEFMYTRVEELTGGRRQLWSCYVEGSYRLTGEHRSYDRKNGIFVDTVPYENFWLVPGSRGLGAWEVAARYSFNDYSDSPNDAELSSLDFALNWYLTPSVRFQMNYIHPMTERGTLGTTESDILLLRSAIYF